MRFYRPALLIPHLHRLLSVATIAAAIAAPASGHTEPGAPLAARLLADRLDAFLDGSGWRLEPQLEAAGCHPKADNDQCRTLHARLVDGLSERTALVISRALTPPTPYHTCRVDADGPRLIELPEPQGHPDLSTTLLRTRQLEYITLPAVLEIPALERFLRSTPNAPKAVLVCKHLAYRVAQVRFVLQISEQPEAERPVEILVVEEALHLRTHLSAIAPFLDAQLEPMTSALYRGRVELEQHREQIHAAVERALDALTEFRAMAAAATALADETDQMLRQLGFDPAEVRALARSIAELAGGRAKATATGTVEDVRKRLDTIAEPMRVLRSRLPSARQQLARLATEVLDSPTLDPFVAMPTSGGVAGTVVVYRAKRMGHSPQGQAVYRVRFFYRSPTSDVTAKVTPVGKQAVAAKSLPAETRPPQTYELTDTGISVEHVAIRQLADKRWVYSVIGARDVARVSVDRPTFRAFLKSLGVPVDVDMHALEPAVSRDLRTISISLSMRLLGESEPVSLTLLNDGVPIALATHRARLEQATRDILKRLVERYVRALAYVSDEAQPRPPAFFTLVEVRPGVDPTSQPYAEVDLHLWQPAPRPPLPVTLRVALVDGRPRVLSNELSPAIGRTIGEIAGAHLPYVDVDAIRPLLDGEALTLTIPLMFEHDGCRLRSELTIAHPFRDIGTQIAAVARDWPAQVRTCVSERARAEAIERAQRTLKQWSAENLVLFGFAATLVGKHPKDGEPKVISIRLTDTEASPPISATLTNVAFKISKGSVQIDLGDAKIDPKELGALIGGRIDRLLVGADSRFVIEPGSWRAHPDGLSCVLAVHDLPVIGTVVLGRVHFGAGIVDDVAGVAHKVLRQALVGRVNERLGALIDLPAIGPLERPRLEIGPGDRLSLHVVGEWRLPIGGAVEIRVRVYPKPMVVKLPDESELADLVGQSFLSRVGVKLPSVEVAVVSGPERVSSSPERWGLVLRAEVNLGFARLAVDRLILSSWGLDLPDVLEVSFDTPPIIIGYLVIANAGLRLGLNGQGLAIVGDLTVQAPDMARLARIESTLQLDEFPSRFVLQGDLVAFGKLPLAQTEGVVDLRRQVVDFQARSHPSVERIISAKQTGRISGPERRVSLDSDMSLFGLKLSGQQFVADLKSNTASMRVSTDVEIASLSGRFESKLDRFEPHLKLDVHLGLDGWGRFVGKAEAWVDRSHVRLVMSLLGIKVTVLAPSWSDLTPGRLINILADILDIDASSLFDIGKLDDLTISFLAYDGEMKSFSAAPPSGQHADARTARAAQSSHLKASPSRDQLTDADTEDSGSSDGSRREQRRKEGQEGTWRCLPCGARYTLDFVPKNHRPRTRPPNECRRQSFDAAIREKLCDGSGTMDPKKWLIGLSRHHSWPRRVSQSVHKPREPMRPMLYPWVGSPGVGGVRRPLFTGFLKSDEPCGERDTMLDMTHIPRDQWGRAASRPPEWLDEVSYRLHRSHWQGCPITPRGGIHFEVISGGRQLVAWASVHVPQGLWPWHVTMRPLYDRKARRWYALATCVSPDQIRRAGYLPDDDFTELCRPALHLLPPWPDGPIDGVLDGWQDYALLNRYAARLHLDPHAPQDPRIVGPRISTIGWAGLKIIEFMGGDPQRPEMLIGAADAADSALESVAFDLSAEKGFGRHLPHFKDEILAFAHARAGKPMPAVVYPREARAGRLLAWEHDGTGGLRLYAFTNGAQPAETTLHGANPYTGDSYKDDLLARLAEYAYGELLSQAWSDMALGADPLHRIEMLVMWNDTAVRLYVLPYDEAEPDKTALKNRPILFRGRKSVDREWLRMQLGALGVQASPAKKGVPWEVRVLLHPSKVFPSTARHAVLGLFEIAAEKGSIDRGRK